MPVFLLKTWAVVLEKYFEETKGRVVKLRIQKVRFKFISSCWKVQVTKLQLSEQRSDIVKPKRAELVVPRARFCGRKGPEE